MNGSKLSFSNPGKGARNNFRMLSEDLNVFCSQKQTHKTQSIHQHGQWDQLENMHTPTLPPISGHWVLVWWPHGSKREMLLEAVQVRRGKNDQSYQGNFQVREDNSMRNSGLPNFLCEFVFHSSLS